MVSFLNSTFDHLYSCREYVTRGSLELTQTLFGLSTPTIIASFFGQNTNIIASTNCPTDAAYVCASVTQEIAQQYFLASVITALETPHSWDNLVLFTDAITYCVLPENVLMRSVWRHAASHAHYIATAALAVGCAGYYTCFSKPQEPQIPFIEPVEIEIEYTHHSAPAA